MRFTLVTDAVSSPQRGEARLSANTWDDLFRYETLFYLRYCDLNGDDHDIGQVKIARFGMGYGHNRSDTPTAIVGEVPSQRRPELPSSFDRLDENHFSVGQDDSYYERLNDLGETVRDEILRGLRDIALDARLFERALAEPVTATSLLRSVPRATVEVQYRRLATGGARLSRFGLSYTLPGTHPDAEAVALAFDVTPGVDPPTNVHVLIGRNGVGKTRILENITQALVDENADPTRVGRFTDAQLLGMVELANLVSVTFSAFDEFEPVHSQVDARRGLPTTYVLPYTYVGLKQIRTDAGEAVLPPKTPRQLANEFGDSAVMCVQGARLHRWRRALEMLETDPIFADAQVADLADRATDDAELPRRAIARFEKLSSGHKIVLLTMTRLVESVEERSLVLLDEPEAHLHPPLLSAFIRALSDLLIHRNGLAIIATHSPVVLQEVPRSCVWKLRRSAREVTAERPRIETFGENAGVLTSEIFGLEVTRAGFHRLLADAVEAGATYEDILRRFGGQLGGEAKAIVLGLIAARSPWSR